MKKKKVQSDEALPGQQSSDYVVGQVSGSLFQKPSGSGSLSALFSTAASPAAPLLFQPPPPCIDNSTATKQQQEESPEVKGQLGQKTKKKKLQVKSDAEQQLENRESGLVKADEDEREQEMSAAVMKRRKRKMKEEAAEMGAEQWVMKRRKLKARKEEEARKSKRTVFVGNLPAGCTKKTLQSLFRGSGSIESIRFRSVVREDPSMSRKVAVIQRKVHPKKTNMNAYVVFKEEDGAVGALQRNGLEIEKDFFIRVDRVNEDSVHDHKRSVFVGNLSFEIGETSFRRHFDDCGPVEAVRLVRDSNSGLGKGFGYILFKSADSVQLALELDGTKLEGRSIRVKRSVKKEKQKSKTDGGGGRMMKEGGRGGGGGGGGGRGRGRGGTRGIGGGRGRGGIGGGRGGMGRERGGIGGGGGRGRGGIGGGGGRGGPAFKTQNKFSGNHRKSSSFTGEMVDPTKKTKNKKKGLKKKSTQKKSVHI